MNVFQKIIAIILLSIIIIIVMFPTTQAISNNEITNKTEENVITQDNNKNNSSISSANEDTSFQNTKDDTIKDKQKVIENSRDTSENQNTSSDYTEVLNSNINEENFQNKEITSPSLNSSSNENPFYDKVSLEEMNLLLNYFKLSPIQITNGIWIENSSRDIIKDFINGHSSYSYSIDSKGYISCDNILRTNENLDSIEPSETEMDIALKYIKDNQSTIISISNKYIDFENNSCVLKDFYDNIYIKSYENENIRILILNGKFYNRNNKITYNLDLSDSFIKALNNVQYKILNGEITISKENPMTRSSRNRRGTSIGHQTVWGGPKDNGTYATIGSVDDGESVYILGKEDDYYHIQYVVTVGANAGKERSGYILRSSLNVSVTDKLLIQEEVMTGGYRYSNVNNRIESCDDFDISINSDSSISNTEGVTLLYDYGYSDWTGKSYRVAFIEYSTSNGMKRGYVYNSKLSNPFASTLVKAPSKVVTYTGPDSNKFSLDTGVLGINEYACAIGYSGNYIFLEYNTNDGRRRAFANANDLNVSISSLGLINLPDIKYDSTYSSTQKQNVSAGPGACFSLCAYRGVIGKNEPVYKASSNPVYEQLNYTYIVYHVGSSYKGGYVLSNTLEENTNPTFPNMPTYNEANGEFIKTYIGQTGLGQPLYSYKIGTGQNKIYLCFNQHGWEDGGPSDGIELVKLAIRFMEYVNTNRNNTGTSDMGNTTVIENINFQELLQRWTIYVIPSINRDGITSGFTNFGPGRTDVSTKIDMNRDWDTNYFRAYTDINDGRNYTSDKTMATSSAQAVAAYLQSESVKPNSNAKSLLLDIHGWDGEIVAWNDESKRMGETYFKPLFYSTNLIGYIDSNYFRSRKKDTDTSAGGYIIRWAVEKLKVTNSMIVELPLRTDKTIDHTFVEQNNYDRNLTTAILNMMKNEYR